MQIAIVVVSVWIENCTISCLFPLYKLNEYELTHSSNLFILVVAGSDLLFNNMH